MTDDMNDDLSGIFDHLTPEDFTRPRPISICYDEPAATRPFDSWVALRLTYARYGYEASCGKQRSMVVLVGHGVQRILGSEPAERLGDFIDRVSSEAREMRAHRCFFSMFTVVGHVVTDQAQPLGDSGLLRQASDTGTALPGLLWYACELGTAPARRLGYIRVDHDHIGEVFQTCNEQPGGLLDRILGIPTA